MTRLLLGEHISPALLCKLGEKGLCAAAVAYVGLSGEPDEHIWSYALEHDFTVVTTNARDFIRLLNMEVHPGLGESSQSCSTYIIPNLTRCAICKFPERHHDPPDKQAFNLDESIPKFRGWHGFRRSHRISAAWT